MKRFLRSLIALASFAVLAVSCNEKIKPETGNENQTVNTYVFNKSKEVTVGSAMIFESSTGNISVLFSAKDGLTTIHEFYNADDYSEIKFPASAIGSEIDLAMLTPDDGTAIISKLPEFGTTGISIDGSDQTVSAGKLSSSKSGNQMQIRCEFTTLTNIRFSVYLSSQFKAFRLPEPDGNYYEYNGKEVEFKSVYAVGIEDGAETYFGFYASPDECPLLEDAMMAENQLCLLVDGTSMVNVLNSTQSIFDLKNLPDGCRMQLILNDSRNGVAVNVTNEEIADGTLVMYFTEYSDGTDLSAAGNIVFNDGRVLKLSCAARVRMRDIKDKTYGRINYTVASRSITDSNYFRCGFHYQNTWDDGITFTYSVSSVIGYIQIGSNSFVEIYVGSKELLNGKAFNVAETNLPFSFKIEYLDRELQNTVPVTIDNNNRTGASGYITFTPNSNGLYDAEFDLTLNNGDITVKGNFAGETRHRNKIYTTIQGDISELHSATLDLSGEPRVLYLSSKPGTAGPDQYDIKGEVQSQEWKYDKFMAFGGQDSAITWIDGVRYNSKNRGPFLGGNWRVLTPSTLPSGSHVSECQTMLFGDESCYAYYYGEIKVIK